MNEDDEDKDKDNNNNHHLYFKSTYSWFPHATRVSWWRVFVFAFDLSHVPAPQCVYRVYSPDYAYLHLGLSS